jgi:hypothetical protein
VTYTRQDHEATLKRLIERYERDIENQDGTEMAALKALEARLRIRELKEALAESRAKSLGDSREAALQERAKRLETPADISRVELDEKVRRHAQATGQTYVEAAKQLNEQERMG